MFNASSGAVLSLQGTDGEKLALGLSRLDARVDFEEVPGSVLDELVIGGFLVAADFDELAAARSRFLGARKATPAVMTITTTMECNLGCYYCYESRSADRLEAADIPRLVALATERLEASGGTTLHVDWYGGEPLLNVSLFEGASRALIAMCEQTGARYSASVISNGTQWPDDVASFIVANRITQVQISFDGLRENHNKRRRYRIELARSELSSFDAAVDLVDRLLDVVRVDLRFNVDAGNQGDLTEFLRFADRQGWFKRQFPAVLQPARLAAYSDRSAFMRSKELSIESFDRLRGDLRLAAGGAIPIEEGEVPDGFPYPRTSVCAALARNSVVVGADGLGYRCGLQVGERNRAVEALTTKSDDLPQFADKDWWEDFDPTRLPNCSRCSFLPICWGGCPKKHLEGDAHALEETSRYWRSNLPRLVASRVGMRPKEGFTYGEADQFRSSRETSE